MGFLHALGRPARFGLLLLGLLALGPALRAAPLARPTPKSAPHDCTWEVVPAPNPDPTDRNELADIVALAPDNVWAVGSTGPNTLVEHWDGTAWQVVPSPNAGTDLNMLLGVSALSADDLWAVGNFRSQGPNYILVEHWDGQQWSIVPLPGGGLTGGLTGVVALAPDNIWAVGTYYPNGPYYQTLVEHWDGTTWQIVPSLETLFISAAFADLAALGPDDIWAVGEANAGGPNQPHPLLAHWDGVTWTEVAGPPVAAGGFGSIAFTSPTDGWAVGASGLDSLTEHWDGRAWTVVPAPNPGTQGHDLASVAAVAPDDAWAAGAWYGPGVNSFMLHWDGRAWVQLPSANPGYGGRFAQVAAASPADLWAVGNSEACWACSLQVLVEHYQGSCPFPTATSTPTITPTGTVTPTRTPYPSMTPTATDTPTVTGTPPTPTATPCQAPDPVQNGGFESGDLAFWRVLSSNPPPAVTTAQAHSGTYAAQLGTVTGSESQGDSAIDQGIIVPVYGAQLSYWWIGGTSDTGTYDWQDAYITDGNGTILATVMHVCYTPGTWVNQTFDLAPWAGQTVRLKFLVHETADNHPTWMDVDDVTVLGREPCATATITPTGTNTPTAGPPSVTSTPGAPSATPVAASPTGTPTVAVPPATGSPGPPSATPPGTATALPASPSPSSISVATGTPCGLSFSDAHPTDYFYGPVAYLTCHGVLAGYADGTFRPYQNTTRGQMVKIVVLGFHLAQAPPGGQTFADVPPSFPFAGYVETAAAHQIVSGYGCGGPGEPCDGQRRPYFRPAASVTRGQLAKIIVGAAGWPQVEPPSPTFADVLPGTAFYPFVETAVTHGIISGYACGGAGESCDAQHRPYYRVGSNATRGQIAKIAYGAITGP